MELASQLAIGFIAVLHGYILWFEMFAWESRGPKVFRRFPKDLFAPTKQLAANQGLYNGFLVAGLVWSLLIQDAIWSKNVAYFFLSCVAVAGIYGAVSADKKIFVVQTIPAILALTLVWLR